MWNKFRAKDIANDARQLLEPTAVTEKVSHSEKQMLQAQLDADQKIQSLTVEVKELSFELKEKKALMSGVTKARDSLQDSLNAAFADKSKLSQSNLELTTQFKAQAQALEQRNQDYEKIEADFAQLKARILKEAEALAKEKNKQVQELDALKVQVPKLTAQLAETQKSKAEFSAKTNTQIHTLESNIKALQDKLKHNDSVLKETSSSASSLERKNTELSTELAKAKANASKDAEASGKEKSKWATEMQNLCAQVEDLTAKLGEAQKVKPDTEKLAQLSKDNDQLKDEIVKLKADKDRQIKESKQAAAKFADTNQENELLLLQLMQAEEELGDYYEKKGQFEELYKGYKARWDRLEKRLPNYVDFGAVELLAFDSVADIPTLTWRIKDYAQAGVAISELQFTTLLHDGHPGIGLAKSGAEPAYFVPRLLTTTPEYLQNFLNYTTSEFKQISAIVPIFEQLEAGQWQGFDFPSNFDPSFWRPSLKTLMEQIKVLPAVLRYNEVLLKRELINPDYEHLWLEFKGLALGTRLWPKFEVRLGAALVQTDGFSQYPKFEFPLIDGKTKPFDSWYAESQDDSGAKLELRFALDKQALDTAVLAKISEVDRGLVLRVVNAMPDALLRLKVKKAAIHRPWDTWIGFARSAVALLKASRATPSASKAKLEGPTPAEAMPAPEAITPQSGTTSVAVVPKSPARGAVKVLSFNSKPVAAKPKTTTAQKAVQNKKTKKV